MRATIYARYSTENQREASVEDQFRECTRLAERVGATLTGIRFFDKGISGGTSDRPGYQEMLTAARARAFDAILAEDLSRLWRGMAEQAPRLAELSDLGVHVITHDFDSRQESAELLGAVSGAMNSIYRREISRRTKRGLEGCAMKGEPVGGRCYGYENTTTVNLAQAGIVRQIFTRYGLLQGSAAGIAAGLNEHDILAPRGGASTILSILTNPRYTGAYQYGATYSRPSAVDSRLRTRLVRSEPLVVRQDEALRIVSAELWAAVQKRLQRRLTAALDSV